MCDIVSHYGYRKTFGAKIGLVCGAGASPAYQGRQGQQVGAACHKASGLGERYLLLIAPPDCCSSNIPDCMLRLRHVHHSLGYVLVQTGPLLKLNCPCMFALGDRDPLCPAEKLAGTQQEMPGTCQNTVFPVRSCTCSQQP